MSVGLGLEPVKNSTMLDLGRLATVLVGRGSLGFQLVFLPWIRQRKYYSPPGLFIAAGKAQGKERCIHSVDVTTYRRDWIILQPESLDCAKRPIQEQRATSSMSGCWELPYELFEAAKPRPSQNRPTVAEAVSKPCRAGLAQHPCIHPAVS